MILRRAVAAAGLIARPDMHSLWSDMGGEDYCLWSDMGGEDHCLW